VAAPWVREPGESLTVGGDAARCQAESPADSSRALGEERCARVREGSEIVEFLQVGSLDGLSYLDLEHDGQAWLSPRIREVLGFSGGFIEDTGKFFQERVHPEDKPYHSGPQRI
jgi:hypothetical protein